MKLTVVRTQFGKDATNGILLIDNVFEAYTLEDQYQEDKVMHETCIPEGIYDIKLRTVGGFHEKYKKRKRKHSITTLNPFINVLYEKNKNTKKDRCFSCYYSTSLRQNKGIPKRK